MTPPYKLQVVPFTYQALLELEKHASNFEYVVSHLGGLRDSFTRGILVNRQLMVLTTPSEILGYTLFTYFNSQQANQYMRNEGEMYTELPKDHPNVLFIDNMEANKKYKNQGLGTQMLNILQTNNIPIFLQATEDSEDFWYNRGFKCIEDYVYWLIKR